MTVRSALLTAATFLAMPASAGATYSLTAADTEAREVGGAGASCVPYEVIRIYGVAKGHGAVNAQAYFDDEALAQAVDMLGQEVDPASVLSAITDIDAHPVASKMQWGLVDVEGRSARATGPEALAYAGDLGGTAGEGRFAFTIQGNILTSPRVLQQARQGFVSEGCDLADRLVRGLEAAGSHGEGDSRCTPEGRPANSAYVDVTGPEGARLHISIPDVSPADPIPHLRAAFDAWRATHPCPENENPPAGEQADRAPPETRSGCSIRAGNAGGDGAELGLALSAAAALRAARVKRRPPT